MNNILYQDFIDLYKQKKVLVLFLTSNAIICEDGVRLNNMFFGSINKNKELIMLEAKFTCQILWA